MDDDLEILFDLMKSDKYPTLQSIKDSIASNKKNFYKDVPQGIYENEKSFMSQHNGWKGITATKKKKAVSVAGSTTSDGSK